MHLFLFVKVRENWADDPERYREMGIEFPKGLSLYGRYPAAHRPELASVLDRDDLHAGRRVAAVRIDPAVDVVRVGRILAADQLPDRHLTAVHEGLAGHLG